MTQQFSNPEPQMPSGSGIDLLGVRVSALNLQSACDGIEDAIREGVRGYVCLCGAHGLVDSQSDPALRAAYNKAFMNTPDGMPLVWELRRQGNPEAGRVYGPDLMLEMFGRGLRHYLYGASLTTLLRLETRLKKRFPQAEIAGIYSPPFRPLTMQEDDDVADRINATKPDIVWVGLGAPKQELWMAKMRSRLSAPMLIGVGAAFDFHAGQKPQAPAVMQSLGLEWLFRLGSEPRRLWRRYLRVVPGYLGLLALQRTGLKRFPSPNVIGTRQNLIKKMEK
jgi:N-acetylglucosaminyldiphosphoundecaprenol N-acetyl-beta-D-mannosaminyltransferase